MIRHILQVKVPVTDLARSAAWYRTVFELELSASLSRTVSSAARC